MERYVRNMDTEIDDLWRAKASAALRGSAKGGLEGVAKVQRMPYNAAGRGSGSVAPSGGSRGRWRGPRRTRELRR